MDKFVNSAFSLVPVSDDCSFPPPQNSVQVSCCPGLALGTSRYPWAPISYKDDLIHAMLATSKSQCPVFRHPGRISGVERAEEQKNVERGGPLFLPEVEFRPRWHRGIRGCPRESKPHALGEVTFVLESRAYFQLPQDCCFVALLNCFD